LTDVPEVVYRTPRPDASLISSIAAHLKWARCPDRTAATAKARSAFDGRFEAAVREQFPDMSDAEVAVRAESAKTAYFKQMARKSAVARRAKKAS
jgi:hypothetical protein